MIRARASGFCGLMFLIGLCLAALLDVAVGQEDTKPKPVKPLDKENPYSELLSGRSFQSDAAQQIQDDDFANPGMLTVKEGEATWQKAEGPSNKSCSFCHNEASRSMVGVAARYPVYDKDEKKPISLEQRINICRRKHMKVAALEAGARKLTALRTYVGFFSRGRVIDAKVDRRLMPFFEAGRKAYYTRRGQLNVSCAQCHEDNVGKSFGAQRLSQGQINGHPAYSVSTERVTSLHERLQMCNKLVRSQPFELGSDDYVNLELYLAWRGRGLGIETPAVRD